VGLLLLKSAAEHWRAAVADSLMGARCPLLLAAWLQKNRMMRAVGRRVSIRRTAWALSAALAWLVLS